MYLLCPSLLAAAPHLRRDSGTIQLFVTLLFDKREEKESQMLSLGICLLIDVVVGLQCKNSHMDTMEVRIKSVLCLVYPQQCSMELSSIHPATRKPSVLTPSFPDTPPFPCYPETLPHSLSLPIWADNQVPFSLSWTVFEFSRSCDLFLYKRPAYNLPGPDFLS